MNESLPYSSLPIYLPIIFYWLHKCSFYLPWCLRSESGSPLSHLSRGLAQPWAQNKHLTHANWFMIVRHSDGRCPLSCSRPGQVGPSRSCFPPRGNSWLVWPRTLRCSTQLWFPRPWPAPSSWPTGGEQAQAGLGWEARPPLNQRAARLACTRVPCFVEGFLN